MLAQAALQNQTLDFSTIMKLYNSCSLAEKQRMVERNEQEMVQRQQDAQQQQQQQVQQQLESEAQARQQQIELQDKMNQRDNDTKVLVATITHQDDGIQETPLDRDKLMEEMRQFDERLKLDREKLALDKEKVKGDLDIKKKSLNKRNEKV